MLTKKSYQEQSGDKELAMPALQRRAFLGKLGLGAGFAALAVACQKDVAPTGAALNTTSSDDIKYGTGDVAILNYAFLLEQLEAAFYVMVTENFYKQGNNNALEKLHFSQIRDHEIAHREFFKDALGSAAIPDAQFDFSSIDFTDRSSVLASAKAFEDLGVSAYNGVAQYIVSPDYLLTAGKIVSVEGRHASFIRNLILPGSFASSSAVDSNGLDLANPPSVVIPIVLPYVKTPMNFKGVPTM